MAILRFRLLLLLTLALRISLSAALHEHSLDDAAFDLLDEQDKNEMRQREIENCVPHDIRSFVLGTRGIVEWSTRRTYIAKVHARQTAADTVDPWQACSDDASVELRFRPVSATGAFTRQPAISHYQRGDNVTQHKAWITLNRTDPTVRDYEFVACRPKHVHTAYGRTPGSFTVQWTTMGECTAPTQQFLKLVEGYRTRITRHTPVTATATTTLFVDSGTKKSKRFMHVVSLKGLLPSAYYTYAVGNDRYSWSIPFSTKTAPSFQTIGSALPQRFLVTGDIGYQNAATLPMMQSEVAEGAVDGVVSVGDYAYDLHLAGGRVGDIFMEEIEPIAAAVHFMVAPGNHETHASFSHYTERFRNMPANAGRVVSGSGMDAPNNWFYSYDVGLVHFVVVSTELYFGKANDQQMIERQETWLHDDLRNANANRATTPWLIVIGHRPMYCTSDDSNCGPGAALLRERLEHLLYEHGADLYICGHQHNYERAFDVYKSQTSQRTTDMKATTHILTGASGQYKRSIMRKAFDKPRAVWDAFRNSVFGYSRLQVYNATHLHWQQVESDPENPAAHGRYGAVADDVWLVQHTHGSFVRDK